MFESWGQSCTSSGSCNRNNLFGIRVRFIVTYFTDSFSATTAHTVLHHVKDCKKNKHIVGNYSQLILFFTPFNTLELSQHTCVYNLCRTHCQVILLTR